MTVAGVGGIYKFSCRLVRMYTASRSRDFGSRKSVEDEKKRVHNAVSKSTAYKTVVR